MKTIIPYPGGKSYMASWIVEQFPEHSCYVEPFGGGASIMANKPPSDVEVYNDRDGDLVQFFRVLRKRPNELVSWLRGRPYAKDLHEKYGRGFYAGYRPDDPIERAGRFFYLRRSQYAGKYRTMSGFRSSKETDIAMNYQNSIDDLEAFAERFRGVTIENRDYTAVFDRFDSSETLFYCDPPYMDEGDALYTGGKFSHGRFCDELEQLKGRWIVSYTRVPNRLSDYHVIERERTQHMSKGHKNADATRTERLVMNYDPKDTTMFRGNNQSGLEAYSD